MYAQSGWIWRCARWQTRSPPAAALVPSCPRSVVSVSEILQRLDGELPAAVAAELGRLRAENARLFRLPRLTPTEAAPPGPAQAGYFEASPGPVHASSAPEAKAAFFGALFAARTDIYAVRYEISTRSATRTGARAGRAGFLRYGADGEAGQL